MRIVIIAFGTRGDVQPALALGKGLQAAGHSIKLVAGANFEQWVRSYGFDFAGSPDQEALMKSPEGIAWVEEPNQFRQLQHMKKLLQDNQAEFYAAVAEPTQGADLLISGFVSEPFAQAASEKFGIPQINAALQPYRSTRSGMASLAALIPRHDSLLNLLAGSIGERLIWSVGGMATNHFRGQLGLPAHSASSYHQIARTIPTIYGFSPNVVPQPHDWGDNDLITGYWFLDEQMVWQPPDSLQHFLDAGTAPLYVGFGSMPSSDPQKTLNLIVGALSKTGQRAIVAAGWSGAKGTASTENVYLLDSAPHEWLFERVAAVVHHGGSGTTGAGLRAGKATLIIPHLGDQPYWGRRVYELGVGAKPITRHALTVEKLAAGIQTLMIDAGIQAKAAELGTKIRAERGVDNAIQQIERLMSAKKHPLRT